MFCSLSAELSLSCTEVYPFQGPLGTITSQMLIIFFYFVMQPARLAKLSQEGNTEILLWQGLLSSNISNHAKQEII